MKASVLELLIPNLSAILTALALVMTAFSGFLVLIFKRLETVHALVNSQLSQAKEAIVARNIEIAMLKQQLAAQPGAGIEDKIRADVATEQATKPPLLPPI